MCRATFSSCYTCGKLDISLRGAGHVLNTDKVVLLLELLGAGECSTDHINVITNNMNENVVNAIINDSFKEQCIIDTRSYLSIVDNTFVVEHRLQIDPPKPGAVRVFIAAGESKIKAIGTVKLTITFSEEEFP